MKKLVAILLLALTATTAMAQHHHHYRHGHWHRGHGGWTWVVPAVIGGAVVYGATRPAPVIVEQPPVYVPPPQVVQQQCTRYVFQDQYGQTIREEVRCN